MARYIRCKKCNVYFDELQNSAVSPSCPYCGALQDLSVQVAENVYIHEIVKKKDKLVGKRRAVSEQIAGDDFHRKTQKWTHKERIIDRRKNKYMEIVIDSETGEVIHHCEEPLDQHVGHGSAKVKKPEGDA